MAETRRPGAGATALIVFFGVLTPIATVVAEYAWRTWTDAFFDPIPTPVHAAAILLVPLTIAWLLAASLRGKDAPAFVRGPLWGAALAIGGWYALFFLPFTPLSLITVLMFGMGLLPLAPLTSFAILWRRRPAPGMRRGAGWGALAGLALLCAADLPQARAHVLLQRATSDDPAVASAARSTLRTSVSAATVLEAASRPISMMSPLGAATRALWEPDRRKAREAAWWATGELAVPRSDAGFRPLFDRTDWAELDAQGGEVVGARLDDLCLATSDLSSEIDATAGVADIRWEMSFRNTAQRDWEEAEARALVQLPPGGVVADATLWVNDTERPAVFTTRGKAREAYENVVVRERRDPLLVTQSGPDQVLVQCFPVPPQGGEIRISLRIAARVDASGGAPHVELPHFVERNFRLCDDATHTEQIEGLGEPTLVVADLDEAGLDAGRTVDDPALGSPTASWAADPFAPERVLRASFRGRTTRPPAGVILLVDASTESARDAIDAALDAIPDGTPTAVFAGSDTPLHATDSLVALDDTIRESVRTSLNTLPWAGGIDSLSALRAAVACGTAHPDSRLLWLHGRQEIVDPRSIDGWWPERGANPFSDIPSLRGHDAHALRVGDGINRLLLALRREGALNEAVATGDAPADRARSLISSWFDTTPTPELVVEADLGGPPAGNAHECRLPRALAALWARDEVERRVGETGDSVAALGAAYRVVTPLTGAVVLETDEDYRRAGLTPHEEAPPIPEPGEWAILALVAGALVFAWTRRRRVAAA